MPREWNAASYDAQPLPHTGWGGAVIEALALTGDETVLDAGCGTGRDTGTLLTRLPRGRVVAVDASAAMLARLRDRLSDRLSRVEAIRADLGEPLPLREPVDAAVSVAAFHWVTDHDALFTGLAAALKPGGVLAAECGGAGNIAAVREALRRATGDTDNPWHFAAPQETAARLEAAGFTDIRVRLVPDPAHLAAGEQLESYLATVVLGAHLDRLPPADHEPYVKAVAAELAEPVIDYVRLQIHAVRR